MKYYDSIVTRAQTVYCSCFIVLVFLIAFLIPDYVRAQSCTETVYGTVTSVSVNVLGERDISYDYEIHIGLDGILNNVSIRQCHRKFHVGEVVTVEYKPDGSVFRIPNLFY